MTPLMVSSNNLIYLPVLPILGLDVTIDDLAHSEPFIIGEPEFLQPVVSYETAPQHLIQLICYFTMLPVQETEVYNFEITTGANQFHRLKEMIGHQCEDQKEQSDLTKW